MIRWCLLTDIPSQLRLLQILPHRSHQRQHTLRCPLSKRPPRHVILADMITNTRQLNLMPAIPQVLHRSPHKLQKCRIQISPLCLTASRRPVNDLRTTVSKLGYCDVLHPGMLQGRRKTQLRTKCAVLPKWSQRLPAIRHRIPSTQTVTAGNPLIRLQQFRAPRQIGQILHKRPLSLHIAVPGHYKQTHLRAGCIRPLLQSPRLTLPLPCRLQPRPRITHTMLQLPQRAIVIMQTRTTTNLHTHMRCRNIFHQGIRIGHLTLPQTDRIHPRPEVHAPDRLRTQLTNEKSQLRCLQIPTPTGHKIPQIPPIGRHILRLKHVVLTLMPHESLQPPLHPLFVQFPQRCPNPLQRQRIQSKTTRLVRIPVASQMSPTGRNLDNRNRSPDPRRHLTTKTQLRTHHVIHRSQ